MKNSSEERTAATDQITRREDKKSVNTKVNPIINFQIGLIAALLAAFLIMELSSPVVTKEYASVGKTVPVDNLESNMGPIKPIPNEDPKPVVQKKQPEPVVQKVDPNKPPVEVDNNTDVPEPVKKKIAPVKAVTAPTTNTTSQPTGKTNKPAVSKPSTAIIGALHEVPLFPGCSDRMDSAERIECLNKKMTRFVQRKFDTSLGETLGDKNIVKITVLFTIGENGLPKDIQVKAPNEALKDEAYKVISKLPQMTPGKIDHMPVNVTYTLPIRFQVND